MIVNRNSSKCASPSIDCLICAYRQTSAVQLACSTVVYHECLADLRPDPYCAGKLRPVRIDNFQCCDGECPLFLSMTEVNYEG